MDLDQGRLCVSANTGKDPGQSLLLNNLVTAWHGSRPGKVVREREHWQGSGPVSLAVTVWHGSPSGQGVFTHAPLQAFAPHILFTFILSYLQKCTHTIYIYTIYL